MKETEEAHEDRKEEDQSLVSQNPKAMEVALSDIASAWHE